jgi:hypothetical protein
LETQLPLQLWKPPTQLLRTQVPLAESQEPVPFGNSVVQLVRDAPQTVSLFASQPPLKLWKPALHVTAQAPAWTLHVETELAIAVQSTGGEPHEVLVFAAQVLVAASTWKPALQVVTVQRPLGVVASIAQVPEPLVNEPVQSLQPGPGPQQVFELTSQAELFALRWKPWLQLATPQTPALQVIVPWGS